MYDDDNFARYMSIILAVTITLMTLFVILILSDGDRNEFRLNVTNPTNMTQEIELAMYKDGELISNKYVDIWSGSTKTIKIDERRTDRLIVNWGEKRWVFNYYEYEGELTLK